MEEAKRRHSKGKGEKTGPALHPPHSARHMAAACWITNSGNLDSPPVKSSLSFPSSSQLSNTITCSPLRFSPSLLCGPLLCSVLSPLCRHSFPLIHYPSTKYLLWQGHTVADFSSFTSTPNTQQSSTRSPHVAQLAYAREHAHIHKCTCNVLARDPRLALKTNTDLGV